MTEQEIRTVLAVAMAYDNRKLPGEANIAAWLEAAHRARWTFEEAVDAVHNHFATSTEFLMPGHVTAYLRQARRQPAPYLALPAASPAADETREQVMALVGETFALPRDVAPGRRPQPRSAEHTAARDAAKAELEALRAESEQP